MRANVSITKVLAGITFILALSAIYLIYLYLSVGHPGVLTY